MSTTCRAHVCTQRAALAAAISFIEGYEDDAQQCGVSELLTYLRQASAPVQPCVAAQSKVAPPLAVLDLNADLGAKLTIDTGDYIYRSDGIGNRDTLLRRREFPESWEGSSVPWHPSYWKLDCDRATSTGQEWNHRSTLVCNDFGYLVAVPDDAAIRPGVAA